MLMNMLITFVIVIDRVVFKIRFCAVLNFVKAFHVTQGINLMTDQIKGELIS